MNNQSPHPFEKTLFPLIESLRRYNKALVEPLCLFNNAIAKSLRPLHNYFTPLEHLSKAINKNIKPLQGYISGFQKFQASTTNFLSTIGKIAVVFEHLPEKVQKVIELLAKNGWYIDSEMEIFGIDLFETVIDNVQFNEAEKFLINYYRENLKSIETRLYDKYPNRTKVVRAAFNAHVRREYDLSIPVFLAQADGICVDLIGKQLYKTNHAIKNALEGYELSRMETAYLSAIFDVFPISVGKNERKNGFKALNRHQVLHGESTDYGTEINSLN
jgi:hypothetical protein